MGRSKVIWFSLFAVAAGAAAIGIGATVDTAHAVMSRADYDQELQAVQLRSRSGIADCVSGRRTAGDVCKAEVHAEERIARAELLARYHGTVSAAREARVVHVKAAYAVARAKCSLLASVPRGECLGAARAESVRATLRLASR